MITLIFPKLMPTNSYRRTAGWTTSGTARSQRLLHTAHSQQQQQQQDYDLYTIDVKSEAPSRGGPVPGIEVTTEMVQESAAHDAEVGELQHHHRRTTLDA